MKKCAQLLVILLLLAGCKEAMYTKLSEREANEIAAVLLQNGIEVTRLAAKDGSITVSVDKAEFSRAMWLLENQGLPREAFKSMADVFKGDGLIPSPMEEKIRFLYALSEGLSQTISKIDGVIDARVHVVLPNNDPMVQNAQPSSASVFIRHYADQPPQIPQIKMLVANSVDSLKYANVSVVAFPVQRQAFPAMAAGNMPTFSNAQTLALPALGIALILAALGTYFWKQRRGPFAKLGSPDIVDLMPILKTETSSPVT
jgi:type III secretion protein J